MRRRRVLGCLIALLIPASSLQALTFVTTKAVRLREGPSISASVTRIVEAGEEVTLLEEAGSDLFFKVRTKESEEGWIHGKYLVPPVTAEIAAATHDELEAIQFPACGGQHHFRWAAKTHPNESSLAPQGVSLSKIRQWAPLELHSDDLASWCAPRQGRELSAYGVTGWVRRVKKNEADGDWHVEITSSAQAAPTSCIVVEIPDPKYGAEFKTARESLDSLLKDSTMSASGDITPAVRAHFIGAAFFDGWHAQGSKAQNHGRCNSSLSALWEIHPVSSATSP